MKTSSLVLSLTDLLVRLWRHLSRRRKRQFVYLLGLMLASALSEVISLGAVLPFLGVLIAPERIFNSPIIADVAGFWGIATADQLVLPITVAFIVAALVAGAVRLLMLWASTRIVFASGADLSREVYRRSLYQPYQVHVARNSSEVISAITVKVTWVVFGVMQSLMTVVSSIVLLIAITIALIVIDPAVAVISTIGFGASYGLVTWVSRKRLQRNSQLIAHGHTHVVKTLQEALGGIRDVLLDNTQSVYCASYNQADQRLWRAQGNNVFITGSPRFVMEALGLTLITTLAYNLSQQPGGVATALPVLGALALGAQRLLPALQNTYSAWASVVASQSSLVDIVELLDQPLPEWVLQPIPDPLVFQNSILFKAIDFRYGDDSPWVLEGINFEIKKGARVGFVGRTGSGKSTMLDLLMGLLKPTEGEVLVDGQPTSGNRLRAWQRTIAHVPQSIFLADATLAENIAFGVLPEAIDLERVREAAMQAQISDYIESQPKGYWAVVGERGIRLSGGQRQRIGIARALYKQASVLVFDEATSALDNTTEQSVMDAIEGLNRDLTILIIAHRLTTVQHCDSIVELEQGRVVFQGTYEQMLERNKSFGK